VARRRRRGTSRKSVRGRCK